MATAVLDLRRADEEWYPLSHPFWTTSGPITPAADDKASILWSFPTWKGAIVLVHAVCVRVTTLFAGGTITLDIGTHTLATDAVTTAGTAALVDADDYVPTGDITSGTAGYYFPDGGDFVTALAAGTYAAPQKIVCADTTVPCISAELASDATITAGEARVLACFSVLP